jgi:hypothetical protein
MSTKTNGHPRSRLYLRTIDLLKTRPREKSLAVICRDTGLPRAWLVDIMGNGERSPSVDRIEILYEYLSGTNLDIR